MFTCLGKKESNHSGLFRSGCLLPKLPEGPEKNLFKFFADFRVFVSHRFFETILVYVLRGRPICSDRSVCCVKRPDLCGPCRPCQCGSAVLRSNRRTGAECEPVRIAGGRRRGGQAVRWSGSWSLAFNRCSGEVRTRNRKFSSRGPCRRSVQVLSEAGREC